MDNQNDYNSKEKNNLNLQLIEESNFDENNLMMFAQSYNKISNLLSNKRNSDTLISENKEKDVDDVLESCSDTYQNNDNTSQTSETETYSNNNNLNSDNIDENRNDFNNTNIINDNDISEGNLNMSSSTTNNIEDSSNKIMYNENVSKDNLQLQYLDQLNQLNQINQINQINQMNQLNQMNQINPYSQITHMSQINQINQLNQMYQSTNNPFIQQQLLNQQLNPMNYYQMNNLSNISNIGNIGNIGMQGIQNLSNINMSNMNLNVNGINPSIIPFLSPMEQNLLINGCNNPYLQNSLQASLKNIMNIQKQMLGNTVNTQFPINVNSLNQIGYQKNLSNITNSNESGTSSNTDPNDKGNLSNTLSSFGQFPSMQLNQINIGNFNNLPNIQNTSNNSQTTNIIQNKSSNMFKRKKNTRFFEANNKYKVEELLKNIHKIEVNKYTSSKIEINPNIYIAKDHLTKINLIAQKRNILQCKLTSLISKTNFETILKIMPETKDSYNFKMVSSENYNASRIKISVKFIKRYLNTFSLESMISKLINFIINPPNFPNPDKILFYGYNQKLRIVLDLDHTLVFAEMEKTIANNFKYFKQVNCPNERINSLNLNNTHFITLVYDQEKEHKTEYLTFRTRTYLEEFMDRLSLIGDIYVNTQGIKEYADMVVEIINKRYKKFKEKIWMKENDINLVLISTGDKKKLELKKIMYSYETVNEGNNKVIFSNNFQEKSKYINIDDNLIIDERVISSSSTDVNRSKNQVKNLNYEDHLNNPEHFEHNVIILDDFVNKWEPKYQNVCLSSMQFHGFNNSDMFDNNEIKFIESIKKAYNYKVNGTHHNIELFNKNLVDSLGSPFCLESDMSKTFQLENLSEFILDIFKLSRLTGCSTQYCIAYLKKSILFGLCIDINNFSEDNKVFLLLKDIVVELGGSIVTKNHNESEERPIYFIVKNTFSLIKPNKKNYYLSSGWLIHCFFYSRKLNVNDYIIV